MIQKLFELLGEYGGVITPNDSLWWKLNIKVQSIEGNRKECFIGFCDSVSYISGISGDVLYDPLITFTCIMDGEKIVSTEISEYEFSNIMGTTVQGKGSKYTHYYLDNKED